MRILRLLFVASIVSLFAATASALPVLQLSPGSTGEWLYNTTTDTWVTTSSTFELLATANSDGVDAHGDYAWEESVGTTGQVAYLVASSTPESMTSTFNITINNGHGDMTPVPTMFGTPPETDPHKLSPHGIFPTYYEIYEFHFDGDPTTIFDTQPGGETGMGEGFEEKFNVTVNFLTGGGVHFDLFTMEGNGLLSENDLTFGWAPYSHDAEMMIPEPTAALVFGMGLLVVGIRIRRP